MIIEQPVSHERTIALWDEEISRILARPLLQPSDIAGGIDRLHELIHVLVNGQNARRFDDANEEDLIGLIVELALSHIAEVRGISTEEAVAAVRDLIVRKNVIYGASWAIMRPASLIDRVHVKGHRIGELQRGVEGDFESEEDSWFDIVNESLFALMLLHGAVPK